MTSWTLESTCRLETDGEQIALRPFARGVNEVAKRAFDLAAGTVLVLLLAPVFVTVAILIVVDSGRPVFHRCRRVGRNGSELRMLKFRKMRQDAEGGPLTAQDDERFTTIGRLLAQLKLDELPQLWHVLTGEMSLVGPRPEDPCFVAIERDAYRDVLRAKPGITGLSQLAFAAEAEILARGDAGSLYIKRLLPQKLALDRLYASGHSFVGDLRILWWTALGLLLRWEVAVDRDTARLTRRRRAAATSSKPLAQTGP